MAGRPKPFSSGWMIGPPPEPEPPRLFPGRVRSTVAAIGRRLPGERVLAIWVVLALVLGSVVFGNPPGRAEPDRLAMLEVGGTPTPMIDWNAQESTASSASISTDELDMTDEAEVEETVQPTPPELHLEIAPPTEEVSLTPDGLLPEYRILTYYGFPNNEKMGILGEHDTERLLDLLREQAAEFEAADPSRPVLVGMEVIASVAQREPQADGSYLLDTPSELLNRYSDFAEANDILLFLDVQIGRRTVQAEVEGLRPWLEKPHVHLALDPEFAMREGEIPGEHIGQVDASDITWTQEYLADLAAEVGIPPKVLIVHQFHYTMIENKDAVSPVAGVQLVIDADGWGTPAEKRATYDVVIAQQPIEFHGLKLFYRQDVPLMTAEEILDLEPAPDLIIYQ
ncbi:MAG TPA: hypothetical protein VGR22_03655 [Thermomicrobiales bacterium]|nr:hypothetical protein [Thermomicrobiales bacterium]